jgi:hypothetical protein
MPAGEPRLDRRPQRPQLLLAFVRHGIAAIVVCVGVVSMAFGTDTSLVGGAGFIGAGLSIWLISWLYRTGVQSDSARLAEDRARRHFDRFGRWPDEQPRSSNPSHDPERSR